MTPPPLFRRKKTPEKKKETTAEPTQKTLLDELCSDDTELQNALSRTLLLNPETTLKEGMNFYAKKAQELEEAQKSREARIAYQLAGEIALYEGRQAQMQKFFKKAAEVDPECKYKKVYEYLSSKENAQRAIAVAKEYYAKMGKRTEA